jgi:transketolase
MRKQALKSITELAVRDERVVFIGSDLSPGVMSEFRERYPSRFFMEGVSEQHIIGMAAGLAMEGFIPYVNTIATFLTRRCYEQIAMDVCLNNLPARLIANGGGMVYAPLGPTHEAIDDFALMRALPNMTVTAPVDANEMAALVDASVEHPGPIYIRLGKGGDPIITPPDRQFLFGAPVVLKEGGEICLVTTGVVSAIALRAADIAAESGVDVRVIHLPTIKPIETDKFFSATVGCKHLIVVDEHLSVGGLASLVAELLTYSNLQVKPKSYSVNLGQEFFHNYGSQSEHFAAKGITDMALAKQCVKLATLEMVCA